MRARHCHELAVRDTTPHVQTTATYTALVTDESAPFISNSFERFTGIYTVGADIDQALSANAGVAAINGVIPGLATWQAFQGKITSSVTGSANIVGCDPLALSSCPVQAQISNPKTGALPTTGTIAITPPDYFEDY